MRDMFFRHTWKWLTTFKRDNSVKNFYFQSNEKDTEIFHPRGIPGKGYFITNEQKCAFVRGYYVLLFLLALVLGALIISEKLSIILLLLVGMLAELSLKYGYPSLYAKKLNPVSENEGHNEALKKDILKNIKLFVVICFFFYSAALLLIKYLQLGMQG